MRKRELKKGEKVRLQQERGPRVQHGREEKNWCGPHVAHKIKHKISLKMKLPIYPRYSKFGSTCTNMFVLSSTQRIYVCVTLGQAQ